jgi:HK97 gp10 family phage protein
MAPRKTMVKVEGLAALQAALRQLPDATAKNVLRRVGRKVLQPVADRAEALAREHTGALKRSIGVSTKLTKSQRRANVKVGRDDVEVYVGAGGLTQAITEEYGTEDQTPHPFMRPAWDGEKRSVLANVKTGLWTEIDKAAARLAKKAAKAK